VPGRSHEGVVSLVASSGISVVILNNHCRPQGGASRVAIDEAVGLANCGVQVTFVGAVGPVCPELASAPLKVICLGQTELADFRGQPGVILQGLWNAAAYRTVKTLLEQLDPRNTIIHLHGFPQALSTSPVRCALSKGFQVVCTLHDFFSACPNGAYFNFVSRTPCTLRALSIRCIGTNCDKRSYAQKLYRVVRSAAQIHLGHLPRGVRHYIGLSRRSEAILRPYLPHDARIHSVPNPIEVSRGPPVNVERNANLVAVGRLELEKGIDVLLEAARRSGVKLTLVGDGALRQYAEASGLCRVTGWITRDAVLAELESARCLVFPSLCYETYGLGVAEAAARGIPAIVSDITAAAERIENGVTGWHARAGDVGDLTRCLNATKDDNVVRTAGRAAYERFWSDPPTIDRHITDLMTAYQEMLGRRARETA